jgi:thiol-disulfide isomerase/thioredoxin
MNGPQLERPLIRMPEFAPGEWLNTPHPLSQESLRGQVVLVDFWDYSCINCIRTLPYVSGWHRAYKDYGLVTIGVHAPEFKFGRDRSQVEAAMARLGIEYPVLLDNDYQTWQRYANHAWPSKYVIDSRGYIRFQRRGEGYYQLTEQAIRALLAEASAEVNLPAPLPLLREEDAAGAVCYRPTPELYAGYQGGGLFGGALGNSEGYVADSVMMYSLPEADEREEGKFYLEGFWRSGPEFLAFAGQDGGRVVLPYQAAGVNVVLSPTADLVELALALWPSAAEPIVEVWQDERPLPPEIAGRDVRYRGEGSAYLLVDQARMYEVVRNPDYGWHELDLVFRSSRLALYAFTFTTCVAPMPDIGARGTFAVG